MPTHMPKESDNPTHEGIDSLTEDSKDDALDDPSESASNLKNETNSQPPDRPKGVPWATKFYWAIIGITGIGSIFSAINNTYSIINLHRAIWITITLVALSVVVELILRRKGISWGEDQNENAHRSLGPRKLLWLLGAITFVWAAAIAKHYRSDSPQTGFAMELASTYKSNLAAILFDHDA